MNLFSKKHFHHVVAIVLCALFVSGCSGSSDSSPLEQSNVESEEGISPEFGDNPSEGSPSESDSDNPSPVVAEPVIEEPVIQSRTQLEFEIIVPAYQSDALQVRLIWGDTDIAASWVGDEFWSASAELPTNTKHTLSVTFYDDNGEIELASFSTEYKTGVNAAETFQITADQFDSDQWDADEDGVSNLDELITGTDPSIDEDSLLEIRDFFALSSWSRMSVSRNLESNVSEERPFFETFEANPSDRESITRDVDIDTEGNGTLTSHYYVNASSLRFNGTRTSSENSVSWEGERRDYDGDYSFGVEFINSVTLVDENTRNFAEEIVGSNIGTYTYTWETSSNLTGILIEGTSLCRPVAGTVLTTFHTNPGQLVTETTINKEIDDPYWRVVQVENDTETREYFVRELRLLRSYGTDYGTYGTPAPEDDFFICDFVDL